MANNVNLGKTPHFAASDLGLHWLLWPVCPITGIIMVCRSKGAVLSGSTLSPVKLQYRDKTWFFMH